MGVRMQQVLVFLSVFDDALECRFKTLVSRAEDYSAQYAALSAEQIYFEVCVCVCVCVCACVCCVRAADMTHTLKAVERKD